MKHRLVSSVMVALIAVGSVVAVGGPLGAVPAAKRGSKINAMVASFDPYAQADQRFIVGLVANDNRTLAYGEVEFRFAYAGTRERPLKRITAGAPLAARYLPIPGQTLDAKATKSRLVAPSKARGVYGTDTARFDRPGLWAVLVTGKDRKRRFTANALFEVADRPQVTAIGEPAPRSTNPLPGAPGVPLTAIGSRASRGNVGDPELHRISVADAISAGKPTMVVVSTPVYCVSQFCGPITDSIQRFARQYEDRMSFVHLEVWADFQAKKVNDAAGQWVLRRDGKDANEPWVFVIDRTGIVAQRFDNVATDEELQQAITQQVQ